MFEIAYQMNDFGRVHFPKYFTNDFFKYIKKSSDGGELVGVEVGTREGYNALNILSVLNIKELVIVDIVDRRCNKIIKNKKVVFLPGDSIDISTLFEDDYFDFVYLDTNPLSLKYAKDQIKAWYPKSCKYFGGDDFSGNELNTVRSVLDFIDVSDLKLVWSGGSDWWIDKEFNQVKNEP